MALLKPGNDEGYKKRKTDFHNRNIMALLKPGMKDSMGDSL